jgi:hypothetical protein
MKKRNVYLAMLSLLIGLLICSGVSSALSIAVIDESGDIHSGAIVEVVGDYGESWKDITDVSGKVYFNITEGYYFVNVSSGYCIFEQNLYLYEDRVNFIELDVTGVPAFETLTLFCAIAIAGLIIYKKRKK